jgi:hypothetical protein
LKRQSVSVSTGTRIVFTYSVFHRILDLKTGLDFYPGPFFCLYYYSPVLFRRLPHLQFQYSSGRDVGMIDPALEGKNAILIYFLAKTLILFWIGLTVPRYA